MNELYELWHSHPLGGSALAVVVMFVAVVVLVGLCRAAVTLFVEGVAAVRGAAESATSAVSDGTVSFVTGIARTIGNVAAVLLWYANRPWVAAWDWVRDRSVIRLDAVTAAIDRTREMRALWRASGIRTWAEFRRQFDAEDGPRYDQPSEDDPGEEPPKGFVEACRLFGLSVTGFTQTALNAAFRARMQKAHPDRDGANGMAARLNAARDLIRKYKGWS